LLRHDVGCKVAEAVGAEGLLVVTCGALVEQKYTLQHFLTVTADNVAGSHIE
jgi:hypothetical protein